MLAARLTALLVLLCALALVPAAVGAPAGTVAPAERFWLGPSFGGLELTDSTRSYSYGECELPEGEGGCALPVQVQTHTTCSRNPIGLDVLPSKVFLLRGGGLTAVYEPTRVEIGTGGTTAVLFTTEPEVVGAALREIHARSQPGPEPLPPPRYPLPVLRELKRVTAVAERYGSPGEIAEATELSPAEVRLRLRIAELLGPQALAGVRPPTMSVATVERLRQMSFNAQYDPARTARKNGLSVAELRRKIRHVRGLAGFC